MKHGSVKECIFCGSKNLKTRWENEPSMETQQGCLDCNMWQGKAVSIHELEQECERARIELHELADKYGIDCSTLEDRFKADSLALGEKIKRLSFRIKSHKGAK